MRTISPTVARRLAVRAQRLAGPQPAGDRDGILELVRHLGCLQLDPTSVVAPSHRLVLWSRLGDYSLEALNRLQWETRHLFEYLAHAASIVLTEDYPIHRHFMLAWKRGETPWSIRYDPWIKTNAALKRHVLVELRRRGPLPITAFDDRSAQRWQSSGWNAGRNVDRVLEYLWYTGAIVVARREAGRKWWDLAERWLPPWTPKQRLSDAEVVRRAAQRSLRALGLGRPIDIQRHFIEGRYPGLLKVLEALEHSGDIVRVEVKGDTEAWPGAWFVHARDLPLVDSIEKGEWEPRSTLLSPFDNLIRDRARTRLVFGFDYSMEIYTPPAKRKFGYYVLPILHGERLIGRLDPVVDRKRQDLTLRAVYAEDGVASRDAAHALAGSITELARFVGAKTITSTGSLPPAWRTALRAL